MWGSTQIVQKIIPSTAQQRTNSPSSRRFYMIQEESTTDNEFCADFYVAGLIFGDGYPFVIRILINRTQQDFALTLFEC